MKIYVYLISFTPGVYSLSFSHHEVVDDRNYMLIDTLDIDYNEPSDEKIERLGKKLEAKRKEATKAKLLAQLKALDE